MSTSRACAVFRFRCQCGSPPTWNSRGRTAPLASYRLLVVEVPVRLRPTGERAFDELHSFTGGYEVEADFGWSAREFDGAENVLVGLRANVRLERSLGFPPLDQGDGTQAVLFVDVAGDAPRLGQYRPLNGPQDFQHLVVSVWRRQESERPDDHTDLPVLDPCQDESRPG